MQYYTPLHNNRRTNILFLVDLRDFSLVFYDKRKTEEKEREQTMESNFVSIHFYHFFLKDL